MPATTWTVTTGFGATWNVSWFELQSLTWLALQAYTWSQLSGASGWGLATGPAVTWSVTT